MVEIHRSSFRVLKRFTFSAADLASRCSRRKSQARSNRTSGKLAAFCSRNWRCTWASRKSPKAVSRRLRVRRAFSSAGLGATQLSKVNWASSRRVATRS